MKSRRSSLPIIGFGKSRRKSFETHLEDIRSKSGSPELVPLDDDKNISSKNTCGVTVCIEGCKVDSSSDLPYAVDSMSRSKLRERISVPSLPSYPSIPNPEAKKLDRNFLSVDQAQTDGMSPKPRRKSTPWRLGLPKVIRDATASPKVRRKSANNVSDKMGRRRRVGTVAAPPIALLDVRKPDFVILPPDLKDDVSFEVHRIVDYDKHLSDLLQETDETHPDWADLQKASKIVQKLVKENESELQLMDNEYKMERVQERFPHDDLQLLERDGKMKGPRRRSAPSAMFLKTLGKSKSANNLPVVGLVRDGSLDGQPTRSYVLEGPVQLTTGLQTQERFIFLFNDLLLVAKQKSSTAFKLKTRVRVGEIWTAECLDEVSELTHEADKSFVVGWPTTNYVATFSTTELKETWLAKLKEQIKLEKEKEEPLTVAIRVTNKEQKDLPSSQCVEVCNWEEASETVKKCMPAFGLPEEKAADYQLWVVSGKENAPYPLSGHELPYSIKLSHIRDVVKFSGDEMVLPPEADLEKDTLKCQFILQQRKKSPARITLEESNKRMKKKSPLMHFFRKTPRPETSTPPSPTGVLFGRPLDEVCINGQLPKTIMCLMNFLFAHGPHTHGIFRKSPNQKAVKELRHLLDQKVDIDFSCLELQPLVVGTVFKDYLRQIPGYLLQSNLYDLWEKTTKVTDDTERLNMVNTVIDRLPTLNQLLLRHLMCLLYHVQLLSEQNEMTAENLAICTGPSLLWPCQPAKQQEAANMVPLLIQHLIVNACTVFGDDVAHLFGEPVPKARQDSSTDSDSMHSLLSIQDNTGCMMRNDGSSIDSLDREFYQEHSPQMLKPAMNLSHDSGLTLSDQALNYPSEETLDSDVGSITSKQFGRSVSHFEQGIRSESVEETSVSRSYDSSMNSESIPVPPPRSRRKRQSPPDGRGTLHRGQSLETEAHTEGLPSNVSDPNLTRQQLDNRKGGQKALGKGMSADSLASLSEASETSEYGSREDMDILNPGNDLGSLHKSASGAHLFYNNELIPSTQLGVGTTRREQEVPQVGTVYSSGNPKRRKDAAVKPKLSPTIPEEHHGSDASGSRLAESFSGTPSSPLVQDFNVSASYDTAGTDTSTVEFHITDSPEESRRIPPVSMEDVGRSSRVAEIAGEQDIADISGSPDHGATPDDSSDEDEPVIRKTDNGMFTLSLTSKDISLLDPHAERSVLRKGMTPKGADVFPGRMRRVLYTQSLHEDTLDKVPALQRSSGATSLKKLPTYEEHQRRRAVYPLHSYDSMDDEKTGWSSPLESYVEKAASDTSLFKPVEQGQPDIVESLDDSVVSGYAEYDPNRPLQPPPYREAVLRKAIIGKKVLPISEGEIREQSQKSVRARRLYEQSQKIFQEQQRDAPISSRRKPVAVYSMKDDLSQSIKEKSPSPAKDSSVTTQRPDSKNVSCNKPLREQNAPRNSVLRNKSSQLDRSVRSASDGAQGAPQELSPARRRRQKSKERKAHRNSDTSLESRKNAENEERNRNENQAPRIGLNRSKSDSAELLNKLPKYKMVEIPVRWDTKFNFRDDKLNNNDQSTEGRSLSSRSVRNRDWHKELAAQYGEQSSKVKTAQEGRKLSEPLYVAKTSLANDDGRKRRWSKPVHPTKDLAPHLKTFVDDVPQRRNSAQFEQSQVTSRSSQDNSRSVQDRNERCKSDSYSRPDLLALRNVHSLDERTTDSFGGKPTTQSDTLVNRLGGSSSVDSLQDSDKTDLVIGWSVSSLRNKYDKGLVTTQKPSNGSSAQQRTVQSVHARLAQEKTVPSETSYV